MTEFEERRLIVNADDFGWTEAITDGIIESHAHGIVTSTTVMVQQAASEYALRRAREFPGLGVGIHLHLCDGTPVMPASEVPSLVGSDGRFHSIEELRRRLWRGRIRQAEIESEFRAQIQWMKRRGCVPTHADSHHHIHFHPYSASAFARALLAEDIRRARCPAQVHFLPGGPATPHGGGLLRRTAVSLYMRALQLVAFRHIRTPDARAAISPHEKRLDALPCGWEHLLTYMPRGTYEVECHPAIGAPARPGDRLADQRLVELKVLTSARLKEIARERHVQLISYAAL